VSRGLPLRSPFASRMQLSWKRWCTPPRGAGSTPDLDSELASTTEYASSVFELIRFGTGTLNENWTSFDQLRHVSPPPRVRGRHENLRRYRHFLSNCCRFFRVVEHLSYVLTETAVLVDREWPQSPNVLFQDFAGILAVEIRSIDKSDRHL